MVVKATSRVDIQDLDIAYLGLFLGLRVNELVRQRMERAGFAGVRDSHGYLIQHLIESDRSITELARRIDITQQAVSKTVRELTSLAQVRHGTVGKSPNPFGISSSDRRVCTTFWIQTLRQAQTELTEQGFLFRGGFGHTPQADLSPIRCG